MQQTIETVRLNLSKKVSSILISFKPSSAGMEGDQMFNPTTYRHYGDGSRWLEPTTRLAKVALSNGIKMHTDDLVDPRGAAVFIFGELPVSRQEIGRVRRQYPHLKLILQILETPIGRQWTFDPANHSEFDAILSYNPKLNDRKRYFSFGLPPGGVDPVEVPAGMPWCNRKTACLFATVPNARPLLPRRTGLGMIREGWRFTPLTWWNYVTEGGSLYAERLRIARKCEQILGDQFDIYGRGWAKAETPQIIKKDFASYRGTCEGSKLDLLQNYRFIFAYENCLNDCGYISEKIFDAFLGGCVPVYLGNASIKKYVPEESFVDARQFKRRSDLIKFITTMPEKSWHTMRDAGTEYLQSGVASARFGSTQYAQTVIDAIRRVMSASKNPN